MATNEVIKSTELELGKDEEATITPAQYFETIKDKMKTETNAHLINLYTVVKKKLHNFMVTGQIDAAKQMYAKCLSLEKEAKLPEKGVTTYIDRDVIDYFIDKVADEAVVVMEVKNYEREIPEEIRNKMAETKEIFDDFFVVFTDYTGETRKKIEQKKREKDPILFGNIFEDGRPSMKMYYIGDWVDEYCDLTLDGMIEKLSNELLGEDEIIHEIPNFDELDEIEKSLYGEASRKRRRK